MSISLFSFGIYEILVGIGFLLIPNRLFSILKIDRTTEPWINLVGALALIIGIYNLRIAQLGAETMYPTTIHVRILLIVVIFYLVQFRKAPKQLYLFALMDVIGIAWTHLEMH